MSIINLFKIVSFCFKGLLVGILYFSTTPIVYSQNASFQNDGEGYYKLTTILEKAPFDSLYLYDYTGPKKIYIAGKKSGLHQWTFLVPDSIAEKMENASLISSQFNNETRSSTSVRFISNIKGEHETTISNIGLEDRENYIYATYRDSSVYHDKFATSINGIDTVVDGKIVTENFLLTDDHQYSDIVVRASDPYFSWFFDPNDEAKSYEQYLLEYESIAIKYPNSRFLVASLASNIHNYRSKEDVRKIFKHFSAKHMDSKWGDRIENFLAEKFHNVLLPTSEKSSLESVIQDSLKYNLVIFVASWCGPCIQEIPLLKRIYSDVKEKMVFTYVNLDTEQDINKYNKVIEQHEIPWRTLYAFNDLERIKSIYIADVIPLIYLVSPTGSFQKIDVRISEDESMLYRILGLEHKEQE